MTDVNAFSLELLQFVEDSVREAVLDPHSRAALLGEAECALIVLDRMLRRKAPEVHPFARFFIDHDLPQIGRERPGELLDALNGIMKARKVFL